MQNPSADGFGKPREDACSRIEQVMTSYHLLDEFGVCRSKVIEVVLPCKSIKLF